MGNEMRILFAVACAVILNSCTPQSEPQSRPYHMTTAFNKADFEAWLSGPSTLHGRAFLMTDAGDVMTCAGADVILFPGNAYGEEILRADKAGYRDTDAEAAAIKPYIHSTKCDAQGHFAFAGIAARPWVIETMVTWGPAGDKGGVLSREITLNAGENQVTLTTGDE